MPKKRIECNKILMHLKFTGTVTVQHACLSLYPGYMQTFFLLDELSSQSEITHGH